jgi:hypothetical protein
MTTATTPGRQPIQIIEIDQQVCSLTYGVAPCTASGPTKCFNSFSTCQDRPNYAATTQTIKFCKATSNLPVGEGLIPSLQSVSTLPTQLNFGGGARDTQPLGRRGAITATFEDHPYSDIQADKYLDDRLYEPFEQGTFWSKWLARNPYYNGWTVRVRDGYIGQSISSMPARTYYLERVQVQGSSGRVTLTAKDALKLADDKRALCPVPRQWSLAAAMNNSSTAAFTVLGAATADLPSLFGFLRIDDEIIQYTGRTAVTGGVSVGTGIFPIPTTVVRGMFGTTPAAHNAGTRVQLVRVYGQLLCWDVVYDLLVNFGGVPASLIDKPAWDAEGNQWLADIRITGYISEPTGVTRLIGEICEQCLMNIWWDERAQKIQMRAVRVPTTTVPKIDDEGHIIADSFSVAERDDERITQMWLYFRPRDWSKRIDDDGNYQSIRIRIDADAEAATQYADRRIRKVFSRWLLTDAQAINVTAKLLSYYRDTPRVITLDLDAKDRALWTGDIVDVRHRSITSADGSSVFQRYIVISAQEVKSGETVRYELQSFGPRTDTDPGGDTFSFWTVSGMTTYALATADERRANAFWGENNGTMPGGDPGYFWN